MGQLKLIEQPRVCDFSRGNHPADTRYLRLLGLVCDDEYLNVGAERLPD